MIQLSDKVNLYQCVNCSDMRAGDFAAAVAVLAVLLAASFIRRKLKKPGG